jgi:hypothetical protein
VANASCDKRRRTCAATGSKDEPWTMLLATAWLRRVAKVYRSTVACRKIALHCDHRMFRRQLEKLLARVAQSWIELGYELDAVGEAEARASAPHASPIFSDESVTVARSRACSGPGLTVDGSFLAGFPRE